MSEGEEKKLFVDEDWKSKAQAEKAKLSEELDSAEEQQSGVPAEAKLIDHLQSLATQAMMWLGVIENPFMEGKRVFDPAQARYLIDMLGMLHEKTQANTDEDEKVYFEKVLPELRMIFVEVSKQAAGQQAAGGGAAGGAEPAGGGESKIVLD